MATHQQTTETTTRTLGPTSSTAVTKTVYETRSSSSSYNADLPSLTYRPSIASRNLIIQRTSGGIGGSGGLSRQQERAVHYGGLSAGAPSGAYANITSSGVVAVKESRNREKKDMQDLNERFASYIEKVRFLEAQNRRLADELEKLKSKWGKETTAIKAMYQAELDEARKCLDEADKDKARLEIRVASLEEQLEEMRQKLEEANRAVLDERERNDRLNQQLSDYDAELNPLRRRIETLDRDRERDKKQIANLQELVNRLRTDLDNETLLHIDAENRRQTLEEELEFLKAVHEQELKELAALAYRDTTSENREFWKNEMGQALREIHEVYDDKLEGMRNEMETFYNMKTQEFRTGAAKQNMESTHAKEESKTLRLQLTDQRDKLGGLEARIAQLMRELEDLRRDKDDKERSLESENNEYKMEVSKLRAEMEAILKELQNLIDSKLGLELEIAAYRKLLEGEENRSGLRQIVDHLATEQIERSQSAYETESKQYSSYGSATAGSSSAYGAGSSAYGGGSSAYGAAGDSSTRMSTVTKGEMSAKTTYQRSAKGPVAISDSSADGKSICLENTGRKEENIHHWILRRNIDGVDRMDFVFDSTIIPPGASVRIWANGTKPMSAPPTDLIYSETSWGVGGAIVTKLVNATGEDRATHIQRTTYS